MLFIAYTPLVIALSRRRSGYDSKRNEQPMELELYETTAQEVAAAQ